MSRVGKAPIKVPQGVKVVFQNGVLKAEGPKGKMSFAVPDGIQVTIDKDVLTVSQVVAKDPETAHLFGTSRTAISNVIQGVHTGFTKVLDIVGVGYRAAVKGKILQLNLGYSHGIDYLLPEGITAAVEKNTKVTVTGSDRVLVGMVAAKIRGYKPPEPYQGKGVRYTDEKIIRKEGKAAGAAGSK